MPTRSYCINQMSGVNMGPEPSILPQPYKIIGVKPPGSNHLLIASHIHMCLKMLHTESTLQWGLPLAMNIPPLEKY